MRSFEVQVGYATHRKVGSQCDCARRACLRDRSALHAEVLEFSRVIMSWVASNRPLFETVYMTPTVVGRATTEPNPL